MSQESTGIHWLLSDTNFILSSINITKLFIPIRIVASYRYVIRNYFII